MLIYVEDDTQLSSESWLVSIPIDDEASMQDLVNKIDVIFWRLFGVYNLVYASKMLPTYSSQERKIEKIKDYLVNEAKVKVRRKIGGNYIDHYKKILSLTNGVKLNPALLHPDCSIIHRQKVLSIDFISNSESKSPPLQKKISDFFVHKPKSPKRKFEESKQDQAAKEQAIEKLEQEKIDLEKQNEELKSELNKECIICFDKPQDSVILLCGHVCSCFDCASNLKECPICRHRIVRITRLFFT